MFAALRQFDFFDTSYRLLQKLGGHRQPSKLPLTIDRKRVYIVPTRFGLFFALVLFVLLMGALNYNNNMALLFTFMLAALGLLTPLYTVRNLAGLRVAQISAQPVFAGEPAQFVFNLQNPTSQHRPMVWARCQAQPTFTDLNPQGRGDLAIFVDTEHRGWLEMPRARLSTTYPVGLFYAWAYVAVPARVLVYPKPEANAPPLPHGAGPGSGLPEHRGDEEWAGLRDYQPGDPSRLIAWKVVARTGQVVTKTFADHHSEKLHLDYSRLHGLDTEQRLSRLARWVLEAERRERAYELILPTKTLGPGCGEHHRHQCLQALAEFQS